MAADGQINIDINIPLEKIKSDAEMVKTFFSDLGKNIKDDFKDTIRQKVDGDTDGLKSKLSEARGLLNDLPKDVRTNLIADAKKEGITDFETFLAKLPKEEQTKLIAKAEKGEAINFKEYIEKIPKNAKTELIADAKTNGIENFEHILKRLPKKMQTELMAKAEKGEAINYEELLRKIPSKLVTEAELNDNASAGLRGLREEAERTGDKFHRLKDIIIGSFAGQAIYGGLNALKDGLKSAAAAGEEYNEKQDTMRINWKNLTREAPQDGQQLVSFINNMSQHSIYSADSIDKMAQSFYHIKSSAPDTKKWTEDFINLGSTLHVSNDALAESGTQFAKIVAGGKASQGDMNVMIDRFPMFGEALEKSSGKSMKQLQAMSSAGKLSATQFTEALDYLGKKYKDSREEAMTSFVGMRMFIKSHVEKLSGDVEKGFFEMAKGSLAHIRDLVNDKSLQGFATSVSKALAGMAAAFNSALTFMVTHGKEIGFVGDIFKSTFGAIGTIISTFASSFRNNVVGTISNSKVNDKVDAMKRSFDEFAKAIKPVEMAIGGLVGVIASGFVRGFSAILSGLIKGFEDTGKSADKAKSKMNFDGLFKTITNISQALNVWYDALTKVYKPFSKIVGAILKGAFDTFADIISGIAGAFGKLISNASKGTGPIALLAKGLGAIAEHKTALKAIGAAIASIAAEILAVKGVLGVVGLVSKAFGALKGAITSIRIAMMLLNSAIIKNPFVAVAAAIIAVGIGFYEAYKHIKPFRDAVNEVGKVIKDTFVGLGKIIAEPFEFAWKFIKSFFDVLTGGMSSVKRASGNAFLSTIFPESVMEKINKFGDSMKKWFSDIGDKIKTAKRIVSDLFDVVTGGMSSAKRASANGFLSKFFPPSVMTKINQFANGLQKWVSSIAGGFKTAGRVVSDVFKIATQGMSSVSKAKAFLDLSKILPESTVRKIGTTIQKIKDQVSGLFKMLKPIVSAGANAIKTIVSLSFKGIATAVSAAFQIIIALFKLEWKALQVITKVAVAVLGPIVKAAFKAIELVIKGAMIVIKAVWTVGWNILKTAIMPIFKFVTSYISDALSVIKNVFKVVLNLLNGNWKAAWNSMKDLVKSIWKLITDVVDNGFDVVVAIFKGAFKGIVEVAKDIWNGVKKVFNKLKDDIEDIWNGIEDISSDVWNAIKKLIINFAKNVWQGVKDVFNTLKDGIKDIWNGVKDISSDIWGGIKNVVGRLASEIWKGAVDKFNHMKDDLGNIGGKIKDGFSSMWGGVKDITSKAWGGIKDLGKDGINGVIGFINGGIGGIDKVIHFFGGKKSTISKIPKLAKGTGPISKRTPAIVNDEQSTVHREAIFRNNGEVEIPRGRNVLTMLEPGESVMPAQQTKMMFGDIPQFKGGVGDWMSKMWSGAKGLAGDAVDGAEDLFDALEDTIKHPIKTLESLFSKGKNSSKGIFKDFASTDGKYVANSAKDWFVKTLKGLDDGGDGDGHGHYANIGGSSVKRWEPYVKKALKMLNLSTSESMINKVLRQINTESGGNPNAVGGTDGLSDGRAMGLMQVKPGTFSANGGPKFGAWNNAFASIYAGLHYAKGRYGPNLSFLGQGHGYDGGGHPTQKQLAWVAESGDEYVVNAQKDSADQLLYEAINDRAKFAPNSFSAQVAGIIDQVKSNDGTQVAPSTNFGGTTGNSKVASSGSNSYLKGDLNIYTVLDGNTIAKTTYPKIKALQQRELTITGVNSAIPVGGGY